MLIEGEISLAHTTTAQDPTLCKNTGIKDPAGL